MSVLYSQSAAENAVAFSRVQALGQHSAVTLLLDLTAIPSLSALSLSLSLSHEGVVDSAA